jgi:hypothetical protein
MGLTGEVSIVRFWTIATSRVGGKLAKLALKMSKTRSESGADKCHGE